jgi:hypothetical protein
MMFSVDLFAAGGGEGGGAQAMTQFENLGNPPKTAVPDRDHRGQFVNAAAFCA